ncbi:polysaccharide deacetylase family protein [Sulfitobacter sp. D35]|uniref:polysaccharide deacetylase family protein n=1 Tax=Sulfitobacter sp. D35 TaxID=3083252 RepID=UPI00296E352D|nr:polysaccharide deacetylase family protein [Sulfitobacter sp. D35]MDW4499711.1 polysaccharide deacetylase family protein [Sulfitobacter sp. D35]
MRVDWTPVTEAVARLRSDGRRLTLWWRDDDAVRAGPELDRLAALSHDIGLPVGLAVIPSLAKDTLAEYLLHSPELIPLVHGWAHRDHAPAGAKKAEFGYPRAEGHAELSHGLDRARALFGDRLLPVFVPPWNRIDAGFEPMLPTLGYVALSTYGPRRPASPGLQRLNTHVDPIDWRGTRSLVDPERLIRDTARAIDARRTCATDPDEPLGLLTHHLVHDAAIWDFSRALLTTLLECGAEPGDPRHLIGETT